MSDTTSNVSRNSALSSLQSAESIPVPDANLSSPSTSRGVLNNHTVTQISNPLLRRLDSALPSSASDFFNYLGSRVASSVSALDYLTSDATRYVASGIEHLASSLPPPESTFIDPLLKTAGGYVRSAITNHVIPGAQQMRDRIGGLSDLASSLTQQQERLAPLEDPKLETTDEEGGYILLSHSGAQTEQTSNTPQPPRTRVNLTHEELDELLDHSENASRTGIDIKNQDRLLESELDKEDQQELQEMSSRLNKLGLKIEDAAAEIEHATERELQKITETFKQPESL